MKHSSRGVTLIELMVVVAIVAILASIAYPSYRRQVMRSNRTEAKVTLMQTAQSLERCFTQNGTYLFCPGLPTQSRPNGLYSIAVNATQTTYVLIATAQGSQSDDVDCATFSIDQANTQTALTSASVANNNACWSR